MYIQARLNALTINDSIRRINADFSEKQLKMQVKLSIQDMKKDANISMKFNRLISQGFHFLWLKNYGIIFYS